MKLFRFGKSGSEKPGVIINGKALDISAFTPDFNEAFFTAGGPAKLKTWLKANASFCPAVSAKARLGSCVARPSKIVCVGLNYRKHAEETGAPIPKEPILFFKSTTALSGPNDDVVIPLNSRKSDWEVEIAIVIGKKAQHVSEKEALKYIAGYCLHNDYSEREWQLERNGQWAKGKGADTFAPLGPWLVTTDEIKDPQNLSMWLDLNGKRLQDSSTSDMIFSCAQIVSYISQFMTLLPGDVISTGTPAGVGLGLKPHPIYLVPGDVVTLGIEGLGTQRQTAIAHPLDKGWTKKAAAPAKKAAAPAKKAAAPAKKAAVSAKKKKG